MPDVQQVDNQTTSQPTYVTRFDGVRVLNTEYRPVWLDNLADDVSLDGSAMNGVVQGAEAVRSIVTYIRTLYESGKAGTPYALDFYRDEYLLNATIKHYHASGVV